jgi:hypothetical protein
MKGLVFAGTIRVLACVVLVVGSTMGLSRTAGAETSPPAATVKTASVQAPAATGEVSFKRDVLPLLVQRCGYCHMREDRHGYLTIDSELAYLSLVNVPAMSYPQMKRVEPGKPDKSFLIYKMTGEHTRLGAEGRAMPSWPLPPEYIDLLRQWIKQGARDN